MGFYMYQHYYPAVYSVDRTVREFENRADDTGFFLAHQCHQSAGLHETKEGTWLMPPACLHEWICVPISLHDTNKMGTHSQKCGSVVQSVFKSTWGYLYSETEDSSWLWLPFAAREHNQEPLQFTSKQIYEKPEYKCNFYVTGSSCGKLVIVVGI